MADNFIVGNPAVISDQAHESVLAQSSYPGRAPEAGIADKLKKLHIGLILNLMLIAALFLAIVVLTVAFSVEISDLKTSDSGQDEQQLNAIEDRLQSLNSSTGAFSQQQEPIHNC